MIFRVAWAWAGFGIVLGMLAISIDQTGVLTWVNGLLAVTALAAGAAGAVYGRAAQLALANK